MLHTKMKGKRPRGRPRTRWIAPVRKYIEMREKTGIKKEKRKWEYRDGWRFLCSSRP